MRILFLILFIALQLINSLSATDQSQNDSDIIDYRDITYNATEFTPKEKYDFIIVGGGTAGCPLAATLSKFFSVLLIERGGIPYEHPDTLTLEGQLRNLVETNDRDSAAESFVSEDGVPNARARILGGSSMINAGIYSRGNEEYYNISGIDWNMNLVDKSYQWVEETVAYPPKRLSNWQTSFRDALLQSGILPNNGYTLDHKVGTKITASLFDSQGRRHGSVELLNKANPKNLQVVVRAVVERIIFTNSSAVAVIYRDLNGKTYRVGVSKYGEVILSAGTLGSTQLLLLSGIGPKEDLSSLGIPIVYDQPYVGKFMVDNPKNSFYLDSPFAYEKDPTQVVGITSPTKATYIEHISGELPFNTSYGPILFNGPYPPLNVSMVAVVTKFARPRSKGYLKLRSSTNASIVPVVRYNYFSEPEDLLECIDGMRKLQNLLKTKAMERYSFANIYGEKFYRFLGSPLPLNQSDDATLGEFCLTTFNTFWHYHGGCLAGKVLDSRLRVKGVKGLRVIDGSILTMSPGTNPQATLMMLGRYMGLTILKEKATTKVHNYIDEATPSIRSS